MLKAGKFVHSSMQMLFHFLSSLAFLQDYSIKPKELYKKKILTFLGLILEEVKITAFKDIKEQWKL